MRIDKFLVENNFYDTRNKAQEAIKQGKIKINGKVISKCSFEVNNDDQVNVIDDDKYVCRGAYKLVDALNTFKIDLTNKTVLDIGASTGGFTQVCLEADAQKVYAVDVGHDQLALELKNNSKVINMEGINARTLSADLFDEPIDFVCMDVSFISIEKVTTNLFSWLTKPFEAVFLIKPQFEVGKKYLNKKGIVKDLSIHKKLLHAYVEYFQNLGLSIKGLKPSNIQGKYGNQEYLIYLSSEPKNNIIINYDFL